MRGASLSQLRHHKPLWVTLLSSSIQENDILQNTVSVMAAQPWTKGDSWSSMNILFFMVHVDPFIIYSLVAGMHSRRSNYLLSFFMFLSYSYHSSMFLVIANQTNYHYYKKNILVSVGNPFMVSVRRTDTI
jgi:hypothetical protein